MKTLEDVRKRVEWYIELLRDDECPPVKLELQSRGRSELLTILRLFQEVTKPASEATPHDPS